MANTRHTKLGRTVKKRRKRLTHQKNRRKKAKEQAIKTREKLLEKLYYDVRHPAGYSNATVLKRHTNIDLKSINEWLEAQRPYTLHRKVKKHFQKNRIYVTGIDSQWEVDLADLPAIMDQNDGYRFLFCAIDVLSKYAWVIPLKRKNDEALLEGFKRLFKSTDRRPKFVRADKGGEFVNKLVNDFLTDKGIRFFTSNNVNKSAIVERFQRTLKGYMWRYFSKMDNERYIDKLQDFVHAYNHRYHRSIKMRPVDVTTKNDHEVYVTLYPRKMDKLMKRMEPTYKFRVGDLVRISRYKHVFEKGYKSNWTEEVHTVTDRISRRPPVYRLKDSQDEPLIGTFYEEELQKVARPETYLIKDILEEKGEGPDKEILVSWRGYPKEANKWIPANSVQTSI